MNKATPKLSFDAIPSPCFWYCGSSVCMICPSEKKKESTVWWLETVATHTKHSPCQTFCQIQGELQTTIFTVLKGTPNHKQISHINITPVMCVPVSHVQWYCSTGKLLEKISALITGSWGTKSTLFSLCCYITAILYADEYLMPERT